MRVLSVMMLALGVVAQEEEAAMLQVEGHYEEEQGRYTKHVPKQHRKRSYKKEAPKRYRKGPGASDG